MHRGQKETSITGQKFGRLTAIRWHHNSKYIAKSGRTIYNIHWLFKCDCGNECVIRKSCVCPQSKTSTKSCGCLKSINLRKRTGYKGLSGQYYTIIQRNARLRDLPFKVTKEFLWKLFEKQDCKCALSGQPLILDYKNQTASLDRIDSHKGYLKSNVQWVHKDINICKWDFTMQEFIEMCNMVTAFNRKKK